jgi:hypothetical protein
MVQITLIQLMVRILQRIVDDASTLKPVKDEAYSGMLKLS